MLSLVTSPMPAGGQADQLFIPPTLNVATRRGADMRTPTAKWSAGLSGRNVVLTMLISPPTAQSFVLSLSASGPPVCLQYLQPSQGRVVSQLENIGYSPT